MNLYSSHAGAFLMAVRNLLDVVQEFKAGGPARIFELYSPPVFVSANKTSDVKKSGHDTISGESTDKIMNPWKDTQVYPVGEFGTHPFKGQFYCIGRAKTNDVIIDDGTVSSFHASLKQVGSDWVLKDENSKNGTYVGQRNREVKLEIDERCVLKEGVSVKFGSVAFLFYTPAGFVDYLQLWKGLYGQRNK